MTYFLMKRTIETTLSDESFGHTEVSFEFGPEVETKEEAEKWAEEVYGENIKPFAIKGTKVHFDVRRKVEVETKATAVEITDETDEEKKRMERTIIVGRVWS